MIGALAAVAAIFGAGMVFGYEAKRRRLRSVLHRLRVEFMEWHFREFPLAGSDALRCMARFGLCSQAEADRAIKQARALVDLLNNVEMAEEALVSQGSCEAHRDRATYPLDDDEFTGEIPF